MYAWIEENYIWLIVAGILGFALLTVLSSRKSGRRMKKQIVAVCGLFYLCTLLYITLIMRIPGETYYQYETTLFWSYQRFFETGSFFYVKENIANVFLFFPLGMFFADWTHQRKVLSGLLLCILLCLFVSVGIETSQLVFKLGLFEFDDMFHNTLGGALGYLAAVTIQKIVTCVMNRR